MACPIPLAPAFTAPLAPLPADAHAYAQAFLDDCITSAKPLGYFVREVHAGQRVVKQYTHHTTCNGVSGQCCPAVTLFADVSPPPPAPPLPAVGETRVPVDWPVVAATGGVAVAAIALFLLAVHHAGRRRR